MDVGPLPLKAPYVAGVDPLQASRGQRIAFDGRGFLRSDGVFQSASIVLLEGTFQPNRGASEEWVGADAVALLPDDLAAARSSGNSATASAPTHSSDAPLFGWKVPSNKTILAD